MTLQDAPRPSQPPPAKTTPSLILGWLDRGLHLGLLVTVASLPLAAIPVPLGPAQLSITELALALVVPLALVILALDPNRNQRLARGIPAHLAGPMALFLVAALSSLLVTEYPRLSLRELRLVILEPLIIVLLVGVAGVSSGWIRSATMTLVLVTTVVCLGALGFWALGSRVSAAEGVQRALGPYASANHFALIIGRSLPFALALGWCVTGHRWAWCAVSAVLALALLATFSIGGWLAAAAALLGLVTLRLGVRRALFVAGGLGLAAIAALPLLRVERVLGHLNPEQGTSFVRVQLWSASVQMVRDHPLLGIGLDNFLYRYQQEYLPPLATAEPNLSHPHNWILNFWLSLGVLGLIAFVWLIVGFAGRVRIALRSPGAPGTAWLALGAAGSMVATLVHGLVDNSYFLPDLAALLWFTLLLPSYASAPIATSPRSDPDIPHLD